MSNDEPNFQFGQHLWAVHVSKSVNPRKVLYVKADTITVPQSGALIFAAELTRIENEDDESSDAIELPPALIVAPGQWYSAVQITCADEGHVPMYFEGGYFDQTLK
jgi:hypothetical protein